MASTLQGTLRRPTAERRRWWALAALSLVSLIIGLDLMVLNVALPALARDLQASTSDLQWFANS